jgi:hypothetical protein
VISRSRLVPTIEVPAVAVIGTGDAVDAGEHETGATADEGDAGDMIEEGGHASAVEDRPSPMREPALDRQPGG